MNVHDRYELTEKNIDRIPGATSEIIFNEAIGCKKSMNHKQSYHWINGFDQMYD